MRRRGNAGRHAFDAGEMRRHRLQRREGEGRQAAQPREHEGALRLGCSIEPADAGDKAGAVGKIGIIDAEVDAGPHQLVAIAGEALERPGGIDDKIGPQPRQLLPEVTVTIEGHRLQPRPEIVTPEPPGATFRRPHIEDEIIGLFERAAGDQQPEPGFLAEQPGEPATEGSVAADDQQGKGAAAHVMKRPRCSGVGTMQLWRPAIFSRLRAMNS